MGFGAFRYSLVVSSLLFSVSSFAQEATTQQATVPTMSAANMGLKFDGMVDAYYAYDFNSLPNANREYTTQPARSDEFNVNLAYIGATLTQEKVRGRLALQAGTSVQSNYAAESETINNVSGPSLLRQIQEGYVGYKLADGLWLDGGIYFSHVGAESFISRDNLTYTRSLVADYSPYYQSGIRLSYQINDKLSAQLHLVNGWQNLTETVSTSAGNQTNRQKMGGTQIAYQVAPNMSLSYSSLFGKEAEFRHFHDFVFKLTGEKLDLIAQYDVGFQKRANESGSNSWWGAAAIARYKFVPTQAVSLRLEQYSDPDQVIIATSQPYGFETTSASIGYDNDLAANLKWRTEYRAFWSKDAVYTDGDSTSDRDSLVVTSFTLSL